MPATRSSGRQLRSAKKPVYAARCLNEGGSTAKRAKRRKEERRASNSSKMSNKPKAKERTDLNNGATIRVPTVASTKNGPQSVEDNLEDNAMKIVNGLVVENTILKDKLKREIDRNKTRIFLDVSVIEDYITCEICSKTLWDPLLLPNCGHTFCKGCLSTWIMKNSMIGSCPKCRKTIFSRPTEDYTLKALINYIANVTGRAHPKETANDPLDKLAYVER